MQIGRVMHEHSAQFFSNKSLTAVQKSHSRILGEALPSYEFDDVELFHHFFLSPSHHMLVLLLAFQAKNEPESVRSEVVCIWNDLRHREILVTPTYKIIFLRTITLKRFNRAENIM